jgi:hypothetical protein
MLRVIIESPYAGNVERNVAYAKLCLKDSLMRNEAPIASHILHTMVLDDTIPKERKMGIEAGLAWVCVADKHIFYTDYGMSKGMTQAMTFALDHNIEFEVREILSKHINSFF